MTATATAHLVSEATYSANTMPTVSILNNPAANMSASSVYETPQMSGFSTNPSSDSLFSINGQMETAQSSTEVIIEALRSKDRLFVLKLGELMENLISEKKGRIDLNPATSYQRLLVHRCSAYYKLAPENDPSSKGIFVYVTMDSKIPSRRISELVPAEETAQPAFKIMRRNFQERHRVKAQSSNSGSVAGEDADLSDVDPSESGSQGGRSNTTGGSKRVMTMEEREAAYNEARSRIFMDFAEKEKAKEKDMSASSSTFSLVSGSASTSAGRDSSSVGDLDDSGRRNGSGNNSTGSSSRSIRSFNNNGGSSRGSRSTSPSFSYASLYEPPPAPYEATQYFAPPHGGYLPPFMYPYPPPAQAQGQMMPPYPYYPPYPYQHPPQHPQHSHSDPTSPAGGDGMFATAPHPHSQPLPYPPQYMWPSNQPPPPPPLQHGQSAPPQSLQQSSVTPVTQGQNLSYPVPFIPPSSPYGPYAMPYYPSPPLGVPNPPPPPHFQGQPNYPHEAQRLMNGTNSVGGMNFMGASPESNQNRRNGNAGGSNGGRRNAPKVRSVWSYGPGTSAGSHSYGAGETVGPRLTSTMRRTSGNSSAGSGGNRTPGDEASSTASSSTTSSSSRRTYTSTSSKHPLPARPDWAVGLKAQPTLSHHRHHDQNNPNSRSPSSHNGAQAQFNSQDFSPTAFQPTDFPPLSNMVSSSEKRTPTIAGAWGKTASTKSIMTPALSNRSPRINALVHYPNGSNQDGIERSSPKENGESKGMKPQNTEEENNLDGSEAALLSSMERMMLQGDSPSNEMTTMERS